MNTIERTRTFSAVSEHGAAYTIIEFTYVDRFRSSEGYGRVDGARFYQTANGHHVNRTSDGHYEIVDCGTTLVEV